MRQQPEQQAPPVQRLRIRYAKRGRLRFTSHRDFSRAFERAIRRADLPMAYSSGFNPHPRISYAGAAPTGAASEAEYLEIGLAEVCDPEAVHSLLAASLPDGLDVLAVVESPGGSLADRLQASHWRVSVRDPAEVIERSATDFLAAEAVPVQRMTKRGLRDFDARVAVLALTVLPDDRGAGLDLVLRYQEPAVRPDDVLAGLARFAGVDLDPAPLLTRLTQGPLGSDGASVGDPFA